MTKEEFILSQYTRHLSAFYAKNSVADIIESAVHSRQAALDIAIGDADFIEHYYSELFEHVQIPVTLVAGNRVSNDAPSINVELDAQEKSFKDSITEIARQILRYHKAEEAEIFLEKCRTIPVSRMNSMSLFVNHIANGDEEEETDSQNAIFLAVSALNSLLILRNADDPISNIPAFSMAIMNRIVELLVKKNHDYGNSFGNQLDKHGPIVFKIRMEDKISRIRTLLTTDAQVKDESIEDTLRDIIGYCILFIHHTK